MLSWQNQVIFARSRPIHYPGVDKLIQLECRAELVKLEGCLFSRIQPALNFVQEHGDEPMCLEASGVSALSRLLSRLPQVNLTAFDSDIGTGVATGRYERVISPNIEDFPPMDSRLGCRAHRAIDACKGYPRS